MSDVLNGTPAPVEPDSPLQVERDNALRRLDTAQVELDRARNQMVSMRRDWSKLNALMNEHANSENWCDEYDEKLEYWNDSFSTLKLEGRLKDFDIDVKLVATYRTTVTIKASSRDKAIDIFNDSYDTSDVMRNQDWDDPYDTDFEAIDVRASDA